MLGLNLTVKNDDLIAVMGDIYVKTPNALKRLLAQLKKMGYEVDNLREDEYRKKKGTTVQVMEKNGWSLWLAKLPDLRFGVCDNCKKLISTSGIQSHGHKCEECGAVTYWELVDGSTIRFAFMDEERGMFSPELNMKVKRWDTESGYLYLYPDALDRGGLSVVSGDNAQAYLDRNKDKWKYGSDGDGKLIVIKYDIQWNSKTAVINPHDHYGSQSHHKIIKIWKGKQYSEWGRLPVPEMISIYESWHWAPLPVTAGLHSRILHAAGQVDDKGWHYQDGRAFYSDRVWQEMAKFIRHFTQLDADAFDLAWPRFRSDGPGGIDDLARFCHPSAIVRNEPNIGNVLIAVSKAAGGRSLTTGEVEAAKHGLADPLVKTVFLKNQQPSKSVEPVAVVSKKCERCGDVPQV